jgi:hypothetical protein
MPPIPNSSQPEVASVESSPDLPALQVLAQRYPQRTLARADRAMRCSPFRFQLFSDMVYRSVALGAIAGDAGLHHRYTTQRLTELRTDSELLWLIQVGLLRREVDGQGLTDSFRVTPLGRILVDRWQNGHNRGYYSSHNSPTVNDRLLNWIARWLRKPF